MNKQKQNTSTTAEAKISSDSHKDFRDTLQTITTKQTTVLNNILRLVSNSWYI